MTEQEQLIQELKDNINEMYCLEDDAIYIMDNLDLWEAHGYSSEEDAEKEADSLDQQASQIWHVIQCNLSELSEKLGRKVTTEDFTDGEFSS